MVRANRSEGKSWCGIIKYHELNQRCNELRNRVAPRSGKLGTARRLQVDTGRGHSQIHHDSAAKHVTVTSSGKQPGARTSRTLKHFLCNILKLYRDTRPSSESLVVFSCFLKADFRQFNLFSYVTLRIISTLLMITEQKSHPAIPKRWSTLRYSIVVAQS